MHCTVVSSLLPCVLVGMLLPTGLNVNRKDGPGWSQLLLPYRASPKFNLLHRLGTSFDFSLGEHHHPAHCQCHFVVWPPTLDRQSQPPCPETPFPGHPGASCTKPCTPFSYKTFMRSRKEPYATCGPQKQHPCLGQGSPFSCPSELKCLFRK